MEEHGVHQNVELDDPCSSSQETVLSKLFLVVFHYSLSNLFAPLFTAAEAGGGFL